ncbi:hypothetical protein ABVK25_008902 [Lepraria finkii]|uniref:Uncharacterized protein n=1 Tax=Lepraria finkii TaxID=1340010 RepID=A0ABR4B1E9_9LECA
MKIHWNGIQPSKHFIDSIVDERGAESEGSTTMEETTELASSEGDSSEAESIENEDGRENWQDSPEVIDYHGYMAERLA